MSDNMSSPNPKVPDLLPQVVAQFIAGIPIASREKATIFSADGHIFDFPVDGSSIEKEEFLNKFVRQKVTRIAQYEHHNWLDGRMPFVTYRELQIWRLRQYVEFIWDWHIPDDEVLASIFNITKRKATNLINVLHGPLW